MRQTTDLFMVLNTSDKKFAKRLHDRNRNWRKRMELKYISVVQTSDSQGITTFIRESLIQLKSRIQILKETEI
jgi:hypothetical protein